MRRAGEWIVLVAAGVGLRAQAATFNYYPVDVSAGIWPADSAWRALPGLERDPDEVFSPDLDRLDFVGTLAHPAAYWASSANYLFVRVRIHATSPGSMDLWQDSILAYIDRNADDVPDYLLAWDTKGPKEYLVDHGLEFGVHKTTGEWWKDVTMDDIDGVVSAKIMPPDINKTGDGYVRGVEGGAVLGRAGNEHATSFIDFAVSWGYLGTATANTLQPGQNWRFQFASNANATDHVAPNQDVLGGSDTDSFPASTRTTLWSGGVVVPEPAAMSWVTGLGLGVLGLWRRWRSVGWGGRRSESPHAGRGEKASAST